MLFTTALSVLSFVALASAQAGKVVIVKVGATASTTGGIFQFSPANITAANGTLVNFQFTGAPGNHTVTQSKFADPCDPFVGGFDSGWVSVAAAQTAVPEFNLTITDDSKPIWFFCKQILPAAHCVAGMVGSINAPMSGNNTFTAFQTNAKNFKGLSGQGQGGLVGVGASASALPSPIPSGDKLVTGAAVTATAPASGSGTASSTSTSSSTPSKASAPGLAANGLVAMLAGALGIVLI